MGAKYFSFTEDKSVISFFDPEQRFTYFYNLSGSALLPYPLDSSLPALITLKDDGYHIGVVNNKSLKLMLVP